MRPRSIWQPRRGWQARLAKGRDHALSTQHSERLDWRCLLAMPRSDSGKKGVTSVARERAVGAGESVDKRRVERVVNILCSSRFEAFRAGPLFRQTVPAPARGHNRPSITHAISGWGLGQGYAGVCGEAIESVAGWPRTQETKAQLRSSMVLVARTYLSRRGHSTDGTRNASQVTASAGNAEGVSLRVIVHRLPGGGGVGGTHRHAPNADKLVLVYDSALTQQH